MNPDPVCPVCQGPLDGLTLAIAEELAPSAVIAMCAACYKEAMCSLSE